MSKFKHLGDYEKRYKHEFTEYGYDKWYVGYDLARTENACLLVSENRYKQRLSAIEWLPFCPLPAIHGKFAILDAACPTDSERPAGVAPKVRIDGLGSMYYAIVPRRGAGGEHYGLMIRRYYLDDEF